MWKPLLRMLWWVSITPLGKPVVPEVYCMLITSWQARPAEALAELLVAGVGAEEEQLLGVVHAPVLLRPDEDHALEPREARAMRSRPRSQDFSSGTSSLTMAT